MHPRERCAETSVICSRTTLSPQRRPGRRQPHSGTTMFTATQSTSRCSCGSSLLRPWPVPPDSRGWAPHTWAMCTGLLWSVNSVSASRAWVFGWLPTVSLLARWAPRLSSSPVAGELVPHRDTWPVGTALARHLAVARDGRCTWGSEAGCAAWWGGAAQTGTKPSCAPPVELPVHQGALRDGLSLLREQSPASDALPGQTPTRSRPLPGYPTRRDTIAAAAASTTTRVPGIDLPFAQGARGV